jgi:hypothetical protein
MRRAVGRKIGLKLTAIQSTSWVHSPKRGQVLPGSISLLRHAEKQIGDQTPQGVTIDGTPDRESLTPRGWQRAGAIVGLFVPRSSAPTNLLLPVPTHLFASEVGPHSQSRRPIETLVPLSQRLGLPIGEPFLQDELDGLVRTILVCDGDVLVAWEHKRIPLIANRLVADDTTVPQVWPDERYDLVWVLEPAGEAQPGFRLRQVPQLLLAGDRPDPIE